MNFDTKLFQHIKCTEDATSLNGKVRGCRKSAIQSCDTVVGGHWMQYTKRPLLDHRR